MVQRGTHVKARVPNVCDLGQRALRSDLLLLSLALLLVEREQPFLKRDGEWDEVVAWIVFVDPGFDFREPNVDGINDNDDEDNKQQGRREVR